MPISVTMDIFGSNRTFPEGGSACRADDTSSSDFFWCLRLAYWHSDAKRQWTCVEVDGVNKQDISMMNLDIVEW